MDWFLTFAFALRTWGCTGCGFILDLSVCVDDLEMDRMWIDSLS